MSAHSHKHIVKALLKDRGRTFCAELGIDIEQNTPSALFRWLCTSILLSTRIRSDIAVAVADALTTNGWGSPEKMADSTGECRTRTLTCAGYAGDCEGTARMLKDAATTLLERYRGDLRVLRDCAGYDPAEERKRLIAIEGLSDQGVDIFFREVQFAWEEIHPFADSRPLNAARRLGLPGTAEGLAELVSRADYPRLLAALVRTDFRHDHDVVRQAA